MRRKKYLGSYATPEEASQAYEAAIASEYGLEDSSQITRNGKQYFTYEVDDQHKNDVGMWKWWDNGKGYAYTSMHGKNVYLHDYIFLLEGVDKPSNMEIDHKDQDKSNNRFSNLILTDRTGNLLNRPTKVRKRNKRWEARVQVDGVLFRKSFDSEDEASNWVSEVKDARQLKG